MTKQRKKSIDSLPLIGKVCLLEGSSKDKINTYITGLKALGATISQSFGDHLTHYIVSQPHLYPKRLLAAQLLDIKTMQFAWVDRCKDLNQYVSEIDYELPMPLTFLESYLSKARSITSINLADIKSTSDAIGLPIYDEDEELKLDNRTTKRNTCSVIPLPTFREYVPPIVMLPPHATAITMVKRRSERISDLNSDDGHLDDLFDYKTTTTTTIETTSAAAIEVNRIKNNKEQELSLDVVLSIPVDQPLPVLYEEGSSEDRISYNECLVESVVIDTHPHSVNQSTSSSSSSSSSSLGNNRKKTSSCNTLNSKRKADLTYIPDCNNHSKRACRSNTTTSTTSNSSNVAVISSVNQLTIASRSKSTAVPKGNIMKEQQQQQLSLFVPALWKANIIMALTGFNDKNGEKSTITATLKQLIKTIKKKATNNSNPNFVPSNNANRSNKNKVLVINPLETSVMMVADSEDFSTYSCNIVIASKKSQTRTLRILFALANGLLIVTEEWVYQSVSQEAWADPRLFPHPRFGASRRIHASILTSPEAIQTFKNNKICVLNSSDPTLDVLISLVHSSGGTTSTDIKSDQISYVLFGDQSDANSWVANSIKKCHHTEIECLQQFSKYNKIITRKFLFNCIESCKIHCPSAKEGELISLDNYSVNNKGSIVASNNSRSNSYSKRCKDTMNSLQSQPNNQKQPGHTNNHNDNNSHINPALEKGGVTPHDWNHTLNPSPINALHTASPVEIQLTGFTAAAVVGRDLSVTRKLVAVTNTPSSGDMLVEEGWVDEEEEEEEETTLLDGSILNERTTTYRTSNTQLAASSLLSLSTSKHQQQQHAHTNTTSTGISETKLDIKTTNRSYIRNTNHNNNNKTTAIINKSKTENSNQKSKRTTTAAVGVAVVTDFIDPYASYNSVNNKKNISDKMVSNKKHTNAEEVISSNSKASSKNKPKHVTNTSIVHDNHKNSSIDDTDDDSLDATKYNMKSITTTTATTTTNSLIKPTITTHSNLRRDILHIPSSNTLPTATTIQNVVRSSGRLIKNTLKSGGSGVITTSDRINIDSDDDIQFTPSQVTPVAIATGRVHRSEEY